MADQGHFPTSPQPSLAHADGDSLMASTAAPGTAHPSLSLQTARSGEQPYQQQLFSAVAAPHYRYNASLRSVRSVASRVSLLEQFATTRKEFEFDFDDGSSFVAWSVYGGEEGDGEVKVEMELELEAEEEEGEDDDSEGSVYEEHSDEEYVDVDGENSEDEIHIEGQGDIRDDEEEEEEVEYKDDAFEDENEGVGDDDDNDQSTKEQLNDAHSIGSDETSNKSIRLLPISKTLRTQPSFIITRSGSSSRRSTASTRVKRTQAGKPPRRIRRKHHELLCLPEDNHSATDIQQAYSRLESILRSTDMPEEYSALAGRYFEDTQKAFEVLMDKVDEGGDGHGEEKNGDNANNSTMSPRLASTCVRLLFWTAYVPVMGLAAVENVLSLTFSARPASQSDAMEKLNPNTTTTNRTNPSARNDEATASNSQTTTTLSHRRRIEARRVEADNLVTLLAQPVRHRQHLERERGGLVILSAKYGVIASSASASASSSASFNTDTTYIPATSPITANIASSFLFFGSNVLSPPQSPAISPPPPPFLGPEWAEPEEVADVTVAVAALVNHDEKEERGSLYIPRGLRKSKLLGFWDPQPGRTKCLMVKYIYDGREGVELVMGREELRLP